MIKAIISKRLDAAERDLGASVDYLRHILRVSFSSFLKFTKIMPIAEHRKALPAGPYHVARIVATRDEDCGTCVQIEVNLAKKDGLSTDTLKAVLESRPEDLPDELADAYRFAEAVVGATGDEDEIRERIVARHGEAALVELAMAIAACRFFPITKRALGYAKSCSVTKIEM